MVIPSLAILLVYEAAAPWVGIAAPAFQGYTWPADGEIDPSFSHFDTWPRPTTYWPSPTTLSNVAEARAYAVLAWVTHRRVTVWGEVMTLGGSVAIGAALVTPHGLRVSVVFGAVMLVGVYMRLVLARQLELRHQAYSGRSALLSGQIK